MFKMNPLGVGPESYNALFPKISQAKYGMAIMADVTTNTFMKLLAVYGIFIFLLFMYAMTKFAKIATNNRFQMVIMIVIF